MCELNPNQNQKELLNKFMSLHKELGEGAIENTQMATALWGQLTQFLNFIGPPYQSCEEWKMYWNHIKSQTKTGTGIDSQSSKVLAVPKVPVAPKIINNVQSSSKEISKKVSEIEASKAVRKIKSQQTTNVNKRLIKTSKTSSKISVKKKIERPKIKKIIKVNESTRKAQTKNRKTLKENQAFSSRRKPCTSNRKSTNKSFGVRLKASKKPKMSSTTSKYKKSKKVKLRIPKRLHVPCKKTLKKRRKILRKKHYGDNK